MNRRIIILISLIIVIVIFSLLVTLLYIPCRRQSGTDIPPGFFEDEKVLFLVPHQDDEIYFAASTILNYVRAGSEVSVAYSTNGDFYGEQYTQIRRDESKKVLTEMGVSQERIYFLGYCNQYKYGKSPYLYTSNFVITSDIGKSETYGTEEYPDYHTMLYGKPASYTRDNLRSDIKDLIVNLKPTVIYCIDFDKHVDHRTLSILFEDAISQILAEDIGYSPRIYKGFAYMKLDSSDFYIGINELSIQKNPTHLILDDSYDTDVPAYIWENRLRLPAANGLYGWTRRSSYLNRLFKMYKSQNDTSFVKNANSDDVFWERRTDSLTYSSQLQVSSGDNEHRLRDFKLIDVVDISSEKTKYVDFLYQPELADPEKKITFTFDEPKQISSIVLYDDPDINNNILRAEILDEQGNLLTEHTPSPDGKYSQADFLPTTTTEITICITDYEGIPGLAEIEIFEESWNERIDTEIIKLYEDNENETFLYHYYPQDNTVHLKLYTYPADKTSWDDYQISVTDGAEWETIDDTLIVSGDFLNTVRVTVTHKENNELSDTISIKKMSEFLQVYIEAIRKYEQLIDTADSKLSTLRRYILYYSKLTLNKLQGAAQFSAERSKA